jgi:tRNA (guanine37-N1)-methyltransferase
MRFDILTVVPGLLVSPLEHSIVKRAREKRLVEIHVHDLRSWSTDKHRKVDDYAFGGDAGMVLQVQPLHDAIEELRGQRRYDEVIYTSPDGERFSQGMANAFSLLENVLLICGHYKGIDHRVREHLVTREVSIGDYVLTGGELAACVICDAVARLVPGVLGDETSALTDSFQDGLLAPPVYSRPAEFRGWRVPDVLLSGNHSAIRTWQEEQARERTRRLRPALLAGDDEVDVY